MKVASPLFRIPRFAVNLLAAAVLCACATTGRDPATLDGSAWMMSAMGAQTLAADAALPTLRFSGDRFSASDGCNRFIGTWYGSGEVLRIGRDLAASRRVCGDAVLAGAEAYSRSLARATAWRIADGTLVLLDRRGAELATFVRQPAGLVDKVWRVTGYADASRAIVGVRPGSLITAEFDTDGRVRGFGGCSPYAGPWMLADKRLAVGPLQSANVDCASTADLRGQQEAFLTSIGSAVAMRRDGDRLELRDASGAVVATAAAIPRTAPVSSRD
jgi:heat shock protein HslJ